MKHKIAQIISLAIMTVLCLSACDSKLSLTVDFGKEPADTLFSVDLFDGTTAVCLSATMDFEFGGNKVSSCRVTLTYDSKRSASAVSDYWEAYSGIENTSVSGETVTYYYVIDPQNNRSSKFSGMTKDEVIAEVERFGGVVRS